MNITRWSAALTLAAACVAVAPPAAAQSIGNVYASGLQAPRGLRFGPDGMLYVAEAGTGGTVSIPSTTCAQVPAPVGPYTGGTTGRISRISSNGTVTTVASGFPSTQDALGDLIGVADVAFVGPTLYALVAGGGCSHGNAKLTNGVAQVDTATGAWHQIANLSSFLRVHQAKYQNADDFEPDGTPYSMINWGGTLYLVEPNHGQVFSLTTTGVLHQVMDISASEGHIVPTTVTAWGSSLYVGNLSIFPIFPTSAKVLTLSMSDGDKDKVPGFDTAAGGWHIVNSKAGFTTIVATDVGPDNLLYVLELSTDPGFPTPGTGKVVRVKRSGDIEDVVTGLVVPTGMTFGPDGRLYISNFGAAPTGGTILQVDVPPVQ